MSRDDLLTLENIASMSRRDLLKVAGVAGLAGTGLTATQMSGSTADLDMDLWMSTLNHITPPEPIVYQREWYDAKQKSNHSLKFVGAVKNPFGDPADGEGETWQFTFKLRASSMYLGYDTLDFANGETRGTWHPKGDDRQITSQKITALPEQLDADEADYVAISARRDRDLLNFADGNQIANDIVSKIQNNPDEPLDEVLTLDVTDVENNRINLARARRVLNNRRELANDALATGEFFLGLGLGTFALASAPASLSVATVFGALSVLASWKTDNVEDKFIPINQGFQVEFDGGMPIAGHTVMFDVYVSPELGSGDNPSSTTVEVLSEFISDGFGSTSGELAEPSRSRAWKLEFDASGDGVTVTPRAVDPNDTDWTYPPTPSIDPPPEDPSTDDDDGISITPDETQSFSAKGSTYGSHPIDHYDLELYKGEISGSPLASVHSSDAANPPSITHEFADSAVYRVKLELTDTAGQTSKLVEKYPVKGASAASFVVDLTAPDQVDANQPVDVSATIMNTGGQQASQVVTISMDGPSGQQELLSESVDLPSDAQATLTPSPLPTSGADGTSLTITAETEDDTASKTVSVVDSQSRTFDVAIQSTNGPVTVGEEITVDAQVTNTGETAASPTVSLLMDGTGYDSTQPSSIAAGASTTVTLVVPAGTTTSAGAKTLTVEAGGATAGTTVQIEDQSAPGFFEIDIQGFQSQVTVGDSFTFDVPVKNTGEEWGSRSIRLIDDASGDVIHQIQVELAQGNAKTIQMGVSSDWTSSPTTREVTLTSQDETIGRTIDVVATDGPTLDVIDLDAQGQYFTNMPVKIDALIRNDGELGDTGQVKLEHAAIETQYDSKIVTFDQRTKTVRLYPNNEQGFDEPGTRPFRVEAEGGNGMVRHIDIVDSESGRAEFELQSVNFGETEVVAGDPIEIDVTVKNTGGNEDTQQVSVMDPYVGELDGQNVTLGGGESATLALAVDGSKTEGEHGAFPIVVETWDNEQRRSLEIIEPRPANFQVTNVAAPAEPAVGESFDVTATIENTGTSAGTKTVRLLDGSETELDTAPETSVPAGETTNVTLTVGTEATSDAGSLDLTVKTEDHSNGRTVLVGGGEPEPANFQVIDVEGPYFQGLKGDALLFLPSDYRVTVKNSGGKTDTQTIRLRKADGTQFDSMSTSLNAGQKTTIQLTIPSTAAPLSGDTMTLVVETADHSVSRTEDIVYIGGPDIDI